MKESEVYRPATIEFDVANNSQMPDFLGQFEDLDKANSFINDNFTALNHKLTAVRFIDNYEKKLLREEYQELLELKMPVLERDVRNANTEYEQAKKKLKEANEMLNATINEVKSIAIEVKNSVRDIELDDRSTYRIAYNDKYYFYTYMDKTIKLASIKDIQEHEKTELFNVMHKNEEFILKHLAEGVEEVLEKAEKNRKKTN